MDVLEDVLSIHDSLCNVSIYLAVVTCLSIECCPSCVQTPVVRGLPVKMPFQLFLISDVGAAATQQLDVRNIVDGARFMI